MAPAIPSPRPCGERVRVRGSSKPQHMMEAVQTRALDVFPAGGNMRAGTFWMAAFRMRFLIGLLVLITGYLAGAVGGYWLILATTSNTHDASVEASMTGAFVTGPLVAIL